MTESNWQRSAELLARLETERQAIRHTGKLGIYAVPVQHDGTFHWRPRIYNGCDPDLGWLLKTEPTQLGWPTWAEAVAALGDAMERGEVT